jgi:SAM-dependent methyltransferase
VVIDRTVFEWRLDPRSPWRIPHLADPDAIVIVLCRQGYSSSLAAATLHELGLIRATDVIGGFEAWAEAGLPVAPFDPSAASDAGPCDRAARVDASERAAHWEQIYGRTSDDAFSWFQGDPARSLRLIQEAVADPAARVMDIGAGTSPLVNRLLDAGFTRVSVLEISPSAVERARQRVGPRASEVRWVVGDVTRVEDLGTVEAWHDRAVFHFLTDADDRARYLALAREAIVPGGAMILATFAPEAPPRCSGLDVRRYDANALAREVGPGFVLERTEPEVHVTPSGDRQPFTYAVFRRTEDVSPMPVSSSMPSWR